MRRMEADDEGAGTPGEGVRISVLGDGSRSMFYREQLGCSVKDGL